MASSPVFKYVNASYHSWDQNPEYIEACRTTSRMGDPTSYPPAHALGATRNDFTSFKVGMAGWDENNLPDIMYQLWPCKAWKAFRDGDKPAPRMDAQGNPMLERYPRPGQNPRTILDFPVLRGIDKISTEVPWWFLELLFRLDPRLKWDDIDMLMEYVGKRMRQPIQRKFVNALNNACSRGRQDWFMVSWREKSKGAKGNGARDRVLAALDLTQQTLNTTRGSTPGLDRFGNRVPLPTGRRKHNKTTTQATERINTSKLKPSKRPSARSKKAAQSAKVKHLLDVEEDEEAVELNDDDSDVDLEPISPVASRPKRKRASKIDFAVEDQSEDSAASEFEPDIDCNRTQSKQPKVHEAAEFFEDPYVSNSMTAQTEDLQDGKLHVQTKKKQRVAKINDANEVLLSPFLQQPAPSRSGNVPHDSNTNPRPQHVERIRRNRLHRLPPRSTSSALGFPPPSPYAPQAAYGAPPLSSYTYQDFQTQNQEPSSSTTTLNDMVNNGGQITHFPGSANGHAVYPPHSIYTTPRDASSFEQNMLMHSRTGHIPSASGDPYGVINDFDQSLEERGYLESSIGIGQAQCRPITQNNSTVFYQGYHRTPPGHHASEPAVSRQNDYFLTSPYISSEQPSEFFNDDLAVGWGPFGNNQEKTQTSSYTPSPTDSQPQGASGLLPQPPPDYSVSVDEGRIGADVLANPAFGRPTQTLMHGETVYSRAIPSHNPATIGLVPAQQAMEAREARSACDLFGGLSEPASWTPEWDSFFNNGTDII